MPSLRRLTAATAAAAVIASALAATAASASDRGDPLPRVPPGFAVTTYTHIGGLATSLDWGPDTRDPKAPERLYILDNNAGDVLVYDDIQGAASQPTVFASGFDGPLGLLVHDDGTVFVADAESPRLGPYGQRSYGRVWRIRDTDKDGIGDDQKIVVKDLPNGRHNTNGMAIGPDGLLYIANGNSTDDGIEGGQPEVVPWSGSVIRVDPKLTNASLAKLNARKTLVATGMRNLYDVAFSPVDPSLIFIPMNGVDDASEGSTGDNPVGDLENSDDLLFAADVDDRDAEHFGYPSCLYNIAKKGNLKPYTNPNPLVVKEFGPCKPKSITLPVATFGTHVSADGAAFQSTDAWGADWTNDLFVAEWGNLFGAEPVGHRVVHVEFDKSGATAVRQSEFLSGAFPLDVTFDKAGNLFVADFTGAIFKVSKVVDAPRVIDVQINAFQYIPGVLTIPEGTTVRWTNGDALGMVHNIVGQAAVRADRTVGDAAEIKSPDLAGGESHEFRFDTPGTWVYTCTIGVLHTALMHGVITVVPAGS